MGASPPTPAWFSPALFARFAAKAVYKTSTWAPPAASSARHKDIPTTLCTNLSKASPELLELRRNLATSSGHQLVWGQQLRAGGIPIPQPMPKTAAWRGAQ